jgi:hypothetical protein
MASKRRNDLLKVLELERKSIQFMIDWMEMPHKGVSQRTIKRGVRNLKRRLKAVDHLLSLTPKITFKQ